MCVGLSGGCNLKYEVSKFVSRNYNVTPMILFMFFNLKFVFPVHGNWHICV